VLKKIPLVGFVLGGGCVGLLAGAVPAGLALGFVVGVVYKGTVGRAGS
jgi:hypothetical protein